MRVTTLGLDKSSLTVEYDATNYVKISRIIKNLITFNIHRTILQEINKLLTAVDKTCLVD